MSQIQVPKGWKIKPLSEILDALPGHAFKSSNFSKTEGIPLIRIRDLDKNSTEVFYNGKYDDKFLIKKGDFLIGMDGDFKIYKWRGDKALLNQRVCKLFNFSNDINPKFVLYSLQKYLDNIHKDTNYTTVKHISHKQILQIQLPIPLLEIQDKIVQKLDYILGQLEEKKKEILELGECTISRVKYLQKNYFGFLFIQYLKKEKTEETILGNLLVDIKLGTNQKAVKDGDGIPVLRMPNIQDGMIDYSDLKYTKFNEKDEEKYLLRKYDVLVNRSNSAELVGKTAVFDRTEKFGFASYLIRLRVKRDQVNPFFLVQYLNSPLGRNYIESVYIKTAGQANINSEHLKAFPIHLPSLEVQNTIIENMNKERTNLELKNKINSIYQKRIQMKEILFDLESRVLDKAFSGKLVN